MTKTIKPAVAGAPDTGAKPGQEGKGGQSRKGQGRKPGQNVARAKPAAAAQVIEVQPMAGPARMRRRHWGLVTSLIILVLVPLGVAVWYLWFVAADQYASTTGFSVRKEESVSATDLIGGLANFAGGSSGSADSDVLYAFIASQDMVSRINDRIDLAKVYSAHWSDDPVFSIWPDPSIEELVWYWSRIVRSSYDRSTGLIEVTVLAFDADTAHAIATAILEECQRMINNLNAQARTDTMSYAQEDLEEAIARLKSAREALTRFRSRTQIVDPTADIQGQMGVLNNLQQQLAQALIDYDLLDQSTNEGDPRLAQAAQRIEAIRVRIAAERESFASQAVPGADEDYPTLMAEYEGLIVDREVAEEAYRAALAAFDAARANASRQSRYLAAYVQPTLAQSSENPQRFVISGLVALFLLLGWSVLALVWYSIRDRR